MSAAAAAAACLSIPLAGSEAAPRAASARQDILAARLRLDRLKSYRVTLTLAPGTVVVLTQGTSVLVEVVNPDKYRSVLTLAGMGTAESITVGRHTRSRANSPRAQGRWQCDANDPPVSSLLPALPAKAGEIVGPSYLGEFTGRGETTLGFQYQKKEGRRLSTYRLYTLAGRGLPRRVEAFSAQGRRDVTADYYDFDVPLQIALSPCS